MNKRDTDKIKKNRSERRAPVLIVVETSHKLKGNAKVI